MKVLRAANPPWLNREWSCPQCGIVVEFNHEDLGGLSPIKPYQERGRWYAKRQCPTCRTIQKFAEVDESAAEAPESELCERSLTDPGSPSAALSSPAEDAA